MSAAATSADWLEAVSTAVAAVGTVGTLVATAMVLRRQTDDRAREQASHVSVVAPEPLELFQGIVEVHNNSAQAITHILVSIIDAPHFGIADLQPRVLLGGRGTAIGVRTAVERLIGMHPDIDHSRLQVRVHFTDEAGRRWVRDAYTGELKRSAAQARARRLRLPSFIADRWRTDIRD